MLVGVLIKNVNGKAVACEVEFSSKDNVFKESYQLLVICSSDTGQSTK